MNKDIDLAYEENLDLVKDPSQVERLAMAFQNMVYRNTIKEIAKEIMDKKAAPKKDIKPVTDKSVTQ